MDLATPLPRHGNLRRVESTHPSNPWRFDAPFWAIPCASLPQSFARGIHLMVELERSVLPESGGHSLHGRASVLHNQQKYTKSLAEQPLEVLAGSSIGKRSTGQPMKDR